MSSSTNGSPREDAEGTHAQPQQHEHYEPTTTTAKSSERVLGPIRESTESEQEPLLPPNRSSQYISVDDPRVSPLQLRRIRLLRGALIIILGFNNLVFLVLLLSDFVAIPGIANRGKSFLELDLIIFTTLTNILTLWYFSIPSYTERVVGYISAVIFGTDLLLALSVPTLRRRLGAIGIFIFIWSLVNVLLSCATDYWVEQGKIYQEIKYTSRPETRKSVSELVVTLCKLFLKSFLLILLACISLTFWIEAFDTHERPWGSMVPVNDSQFQVHLACFGDVKRSSNFDSNSNSGNTTQQPIILIEGGQHTSSEVFQSWVEELYHLNKIERYCIWDRPGYGFSENAPSPTSLGIISEYLGEALEKQGIKGPFSLVAFDIGGLYARMFAYQNVEKIHSILLVDSWNEKMLRNNPFRLSGKKEDKNTFKNILELMDVRTGLSVWWRGILSPLGLRTNLHWFLHPMKYSSNSRIFGLEMQYQSRYLKARLQEQVTSSVLSFNEILGSNLYDIPLTVVSSDLMIKNSLNWGKWQRELTKISSQTQEWVISKGAGHFIWKTPSGKTLLQDLLLRLLGED